MTGNREGRIRRVQRSPRGEWKRDTKYGFGAYYYMNGDVYEGSWKKNFRHGMGSYLYAATGTKFLGTWIIDRMQGPGQLIHPRHRFHGFWELNLPYGRGCFTFENASMQHGHYVHVKDSEHKTLEEYPEQKPTTDAEKEMQNRAWAEPLPLKEGIIPLWRARCITSYNPDLLPPEPVPLQEEASLESIVDKCSEESLMEPEQYLQYPEEHEGEYDAYYGEINLPTGSLEAI